MSDILTASLTPAQAAAALAQAAQTRQPVVPLRDRMADLSASAAYAIQEINTRAALAAGRRLVGRKIGLTSLAVQAQLGVDQPDFGMLFADMAVGDGEMIPAGRLIQPKVEAEVALVIGRDLTRERHTYLDLIAATDCLLPAIEVVDSRIAGWNIRFFDTVADNASSGLFVLGSQPRLLREVDLAGCRMEMRHSGTGPSPAEAAAGVAVVSRGSGRACLGNPLNAAVWLADTMVRCGRPLLAGDVILSGALGPMVSVEGSACFEAEISGLGSVCALFA